MVTWQDPDEPTGVGSDRSPRHNSAGGSSSRPRTRKADMAVSMRLSGASWAEIAQVCGFATPRAALLATERALIRRLDEEDKAQMRQLAGARLERLLRGVWNKAIDSDHPEHLAAVAKAREIIDRHAKLFGLDAPTEIVVHNPTKAELETWVMRVVSAGSPEVEESNIFEAEVVEEEPRALPA